MEQKNYKRTELEERKNEVEQVLEKWKNAFHDIGCYLNIPKSEFVWAATMPNYEHNYMEELNTYMEDHDTEVLSFINNFDLDNCTIDQIRQANEYLEHDLTTSTKLRLKVLLNKIDNKIRSKMDDAPFKEYHEDLITGKTKIDINKTDDEKALEYIRNFDISKANETHSSYITETLFQLNINDDTTNKLIKLLNDIEIVINRKEQKELNKKVMKALSDRIDNNNKTLFVPQKSKEEISMKDEKTYDEIIDKNTTESSVSGTTIPNPKSEVAADESEDVETIFSLEDFANEQKAFFDKLYNLGRVKQKEYSRGKSAFHNFERSKDLSFHKTRTKSAWEYMVKHLQSVKDLLDDEERGEYIDPKVVDEKIGDIIIYMTLIRSMLIN